MSKENTYKLDKKDADLALANILKEVGQENSCIEKDVKVLSSIKNKSTKSYTFMIHFAAILLCITFFLPVLIPLATSVSEKFFKASPVRYEDDSYSESVITFTLSGDNILFSESYSEYPDGRREEPVSYDKIKKTISFRYDNTDDLNIYIPVFNSTTLQIVLSPKKNVE